MTSVKLTYNSLVKYLMIWCILQDFVLSILYKIIGNAVLINLIFYSKDVMLVVLFLWALKKIFRKNKYQMIIYIYLLIVVFAVLISMSKGDSTISSIIQNVRNVILLPCFCLIGYSIKNRNDFEKFITNKYFKWILISVIFGIADYCLDMTIGTADWWKTGIGFTNYYSDIKQQAGKMLFGLPGNFYGSYGVGYFAVKRLVGFWGNPLTCAYTLVIPLFYTFLKIAEKRNFRKINKGNIFSIFTFVILFLGLYFSHTRAILFLFGIIALVYIFLYMKKSPWLFLCTTSIFCIVLFMIDYSSIIKFVYDGSTIGHIQEVSNFLKQVRISVLGHGIDFAGTSSATDIGTESAYLTLIGNVGVVGMIFYVIIFAVPIRKIFKSFSKNSTMRKAVGLSGIVLMITGLLSEQLFAYTTIAPFYILMGYEFAGSCYRIES